MEAINSFELLAGGEKAINIMLSRRKFVAGTALGAAAWALGCQEQPASQSAQIKGAGSSKPTVLATWNNMAANEAA